MQTVRIFSGGCRDSDWVLFDNPAYCYASYTCLADEVHIVGRVLWTSRPSLSLRPASPGPLQNRTAVAGPFGARALEQKSRLGRHLPAGTGPVRMGSPPEDEARVGRQRPAAGLEAP